MAKPLNLKVDHSAKTTLAEQIRSEIATAIESCVLGALRLDLLAHGGLPAGCPGSNHQERLCSSLGDVIEKRTA